MGTTAAVTVCRRSIAVEAGGWPGERRPRTDEQTREPLVEFEVGRIIRLEIFNDQVLTDGPEGKPFKIIGSTLLIWVDLEPDAKFAHPTTYVLIAATGTRVRRGD